MDYRGCIFNRPSGFQGSRIKESWIRLVVGCVFWSITASACAARQDAKSDLAADGSLNKPTPVRYLDLEQYAGTWYEIASFPQWFQKGCHCTRARYSINDDGTVGVLNTCNRDGIDGKYSEADGVARVVRQAREDESYSRLKVYFFLPWLRLFGGDYWVIGLADDYSWAVVGDPARKYLWILSRTPTLNEDTRSEVMAVIAAQGYQTEPLQWTVQSGCSYPD